MIIFHTITRQHERVARVLTCYINHVEKVGHYKPNSHNAQCFFNTLSAKLFRLLNGLIDREYTMVF